MSKPFTRSSILYDVAGASPTSYFLLNLNCTMVQWWWELTVNHFKLDADKTKASSFIVIHVTIKFSLSFVSFYFHFIFMWFLSLSLHTPPQFYYVISDWGLVVEKQRFFAWPMNTARRRSRREEGYNILFVGWCDPNFSVLSLFIPVLITIILHSSNVYDIKLCSLETW